MTQIFFNSRALLQPLTGVQRCVQEWSKCVGHDLHAVKPSSKSFASGMKGHLWEQFSLPSRIRDNLLWSPANTGPLSVRNQVVTIHDASTLDHPEWFNRSFASVYQFLLPRLAQRVLGITTVSQFSKERLLHYFKIPEECIQVVANGIGREFQKVEEEQVLKTKKILGINRPYFLYVGSIDPRKNLKTLFNAWQAASLNDFELIIVGARNTIFDQDALHTCEKGIRFLGRVPNDLLVPLYCGAYASIAPSLYEGFGLPLLESLACGTPCIASDIPPHREVGADSAVYVNANSHSDWTEALRGAAKWTTEKRELLGINGLERGSLFSWESSAASHLRILESFARNLESSGPRKTNSFKKHTFHKNPEEELVTLMGRDYLKGRKIGKVGLGFLLLRDLFIDSIFSVKKLPLPELHSLREICICKSDHLGDLLMATPFLRELRSKAPDARITLLVSENTLELSHILKEQGLIDDSLPYTPFLLNRQKHSLVTKISNEWRQQSQVARTFKDRSLDLFIDLRIHSPNAWHLGIMTGAKYRLGFGLRGMSGSYHGLLKHNSLQSVPQVYLDCLPKNQRRSAIYLKPILESVLIESKILSRLPQTPFVVVQAVAGEPARNMDPRDWLEICEAISRHAPIVMLGEALPAKVMQKFECLPSVTTLMGETSIREALGVISLSCGVISVDSFAAHVALAYEKPVAILMKEGFSNRKSYPQKNANLHFVDSHNICADSIIGFLGLSEKVRFCP